VGLSDRNSMNILIDQATAEVVHIELGVAFEQGLMLKTPKRGLSHQLFDYCLSFSFLQIVLYLLLFSQLVYILNKFRSGSQGILSMVWE
jgi:phosphatidylinositol kinase/protein kinase (PI-3  family)